MKVDSLVHSSERRSDRGIPENHRAQWEKDRAKKTGYKRNRERACLETAVDAIAIKKDGRAGNNAVLIAASLYPRSSNKSVASSRIWVVVLPPADKATRGPREGHAFCLRVNRFDGCT